MAEKDFMLPTLATLNGLTSPPPAATPASQVNNQSRINPGKATLPGVGGNVAPAFVTPTNAYAHDPNVVSSDPITDNSLNTQWQPNILDNYDDVTYHFKLFIVDPETSSSGKVFTLEKQTIIAESGVTDLIIDKVEINTITTPSTETGTGTSTGVKFEITEPAGAGMIDKLFYQSVALGIGNWLVMPVYLQLSFKDRDVPASEPDYGEKDSLANLKWLWTLKITKIKANITSVGTVYEFEAIVFNEYCQSNAVSSLQQTTTLTNLSTFKDAMAQLQDKLNLDQRLKLINTYSIRDVFKIVVDPKLAGLKITPSDKNTNSRKADNYVTWGNKDATFTGGVAIDKIIDSLLSQTKEAQIVMKRSISAPANGVPIMQEPEQMKDFWRVITEVRPLKYDPRREDISKEFTIFIVEYDVGVLDQHNPQTTRQPETIPAEKRRLQEYLGKSILKKKYNYIFTGLNDQIVNLDLTINNAFAAATARFGGIYSNSAMTSKGVVTHEHAKEERAADELIGAAITLQNNAKGSVAEKAATDRAIAAIHNNKTFSANERADRIKLVLGVDDNSPHPSTNIAPQVRTQAENQELHFLSDVDVQGDAAKAAYATFSSYAAGKVRPTARIEATQDHQVGQGVESNSNSGIQKLSTLFSSALHSSIDASLIQAKMTIKGDPFWLYPQAYEDDNYQIFNTLKSEAEAIQWLKQAQFMVKDAVNYYGSDNFLMLRFRTPRIYGPEDTVRDTDTPNIYVETLSGIYKVISVIHKFSAGKFEQELSLLLDTEINLTNFTAQIEADAQKKDIPAKPRDLLPRGNLMPTGETSLDRRRAAVDAQEEGRSAPTENLANLATPGRSLVTLERSNIPAPNPLLPRPQ